MDLFVRAKDLKEDDYEPQIEADNIQELIDWVD